MGFSRDVFYFYYLKRDKKLTMIFKKNAAGKTAKNHITKRKWGKTNVVLILLLGVIACLIFFCHKDKTSPSNDTSRNIPPFHRQESPAPEIVIQRILLQPSQPTKRDTVKAEIILSESAKVSGKQFQYIYNWKVNTQHISDAVGDTLQLAEFEIDDLVMVTIIPYDEGVAKPARTSYSVRISAVPPSLELRLTQDKFIAGKPFECRLISKHPDSETVTFALEEPKVEGMTINAKTGIITWSVPAVPPKILEFGASVIDPRGNKTTRIFTFALNLNTDSSTPAGTD